MEFPDDPEIFVWLLNELLIIRELGLWDVQHQADGRVVMLMACVAILRAWRPLAQEGSAAGNVLWSTRGSSEPVLIPQRGREL